MPKNVSGKVIGYFDQDGFAYCLNHARVRDEAISQDNCDKSEQCSICGVYLNDSE